MSDLRKFKRGADKGAPPLDQTNDNLSKPPRTARPTKGKIHFSVPVEVLDDFAIAAGRRFGFKKGSKSALFLAMWEDYKGRTSG